MADDIVKRLREFSYEDDYGRPSYPDITEEAADEIERLRAALKPFADDFRKNWTRGEADDDFIYEPVCGLKVGDLRRASEALTHEQSGDAK